MRFLAALLVCFLGACAPTVQAQGAFEDCCISYHRSMPWAVLQRAQAYTCQHVSGSCNLPAVIFFLPRRVLCGNPQDRRVQIMVKLLERKRKRNQGLHGRPGKLSLRPRAKVPTASQGFCLLP